MPVNSEIARPLLQLCTVYDESANMRSWRRDTAGFVDVRRSVRISFVMTGVAMVRRDVDAISARAARCKVIIFQKFRPSMGPESGLDVASGQRGVMDADLQDRPSSFSVRAKWKEG